MRGQHEHDRARGHRLQAGLCRRRDLRIRDVRRGMLKLHRCRLPIRSRSYACALCTQEKSLVDTALSIGEQLLPRNILDTYLHTNLMGIIVFFMLAGKSVATQKNQKAVSQIFDMVEVIGEAFMAVIITCGA